VNLPVGRYLKTTLFIAVVSSICYSLLPLVGYRAMGSVFLFSILGVSVVTSRGPILFAALAFAFIWNFFFIPPQFTFAIHAWEDIMMVLSFFVTALVAGVLTEIAQSAKLYKASEALHQTLLNSISHELRTPITAIVGSATALKDTSTLLNPRARESLTDELIKSALRLDRVVENLLDLTRLQRGTLQLKKEWFDLGELLSAVRTGLKEESQSRRLELVNDESVLVEGDFYLLSHALNQVVLNAIKYTPENSKIEIESLASEDEARIIVRDNGKGIPEGLERKIFEKFYRTPGTPVGGLGLGLSIASSIIELHGGRMWARNRVDSTGAVFEIRLPSKPAPAALQKAMQ
jgi:two-component system, OmpR family, sensor histidine kinase KdpD